AIEALGITVEDRGNIPIELLELAQEGDPKQRYLHEITRAARGLAKEVKYAHEHSALPIALGGDHSVVIGSIAGTAAYFRDKGEAMGLVWLDAPGDLHTAEAAPSGNIHPIPP